MSEAADVPQTVQQLGSEKGQDDLAREAQLTKSWQDLATLVRETCTCLIQGQEKI